MTYFVARYDLRRYLAEGSPSHAELYAAALEQARYVDEAGFDSLVVSEHHAVPDGYLPSPFVFVAALAARTTRIFLTVAASLAPLHDPVRLAEDLAVVDLVSGGRVICVLGLGYRPEEYALFERAWAARGEHMERTLEVLTAIWSGEPVRRGGREHVLTPALRDSARRLVFYGGGSTAAARRAARFGLGFYPQVADVELAEVYRQACIELGRDPGAVVQPPPGPGTVFCSHDPDGFWDRWGMHLAHDARSYAAWHGSATSFVRDTSGDVDEMRRAGVYVVATPDELIERCRAGEYGAVTAHPLCGGLPPDASWESLRLLGDVVIPAVRARR